MTRAPANRILPGPEAAKGHAAMLAFSALVAGSFSFGRLAAPHIDPMALNALRFSLALVFMGAWVLGRGLLRPEHLRAPWRYLLLGGLYAVYFTLMFEGLKTAGAVSMAAVFTLTPVMTAGFGWLLLRQVTTARMALALAVAAAGAVWVIFDADPTAIAGFEVGRGEAIFFLGCIAHALYAPLVPKLRRSEPIAVLTLGTICGALLVLLITGGPAMARTDWAAMPGIVWAVILYLAVFASTVTFGLIQYAVLRLPGAKVMAYTYLIPVWVIGWEAALGAGLPPAAILPGIGAVVLGLVLLLKD